MNNWGSGSYTSGWNANYILLRRRHKMNTIPTKKQKKF